MKSTKVKAGAAVAILALLGSMGVSGTASAVPDTPNPQATVGGENQAAPNPALIKADAKTQLSIHKYMGVPATNAKYGTGKIYDAVKDLPPLKNVKFQIRRVEGINLATNEGWKTAKDLQNQAITLNAKNKVTVGTKEYALGSAHSGVTDHSGVATITVDNGVGLYLVTEDLAGSSNIQDNNGKHYQNTQITGIAPFLVTLPMTDPDARHSWMYDVHVYPKNQYDEISKKVFDGNVGKEGQDTYKIGQEATYQLESTIWAFDQNQDQHVDHKDLTYYLIKDQLPKETKYKSSQLSIVRDDKSVQNLEADKDYKVFGAEATASNPLSFSFTQEGLDKLAKNSGAKVRTEIRVVIEKMPKDGNVLNEASFVPNGRFWTDRGYQPPTPGGLPSLQQGENQPTPEGTSQYREIPSNKVLSRFGDILIEKVSDEGKPLPGAKFAVYRAVNNNDGHGFTCKNVDFKTAKAIATSDASTADGYTSIKGLQLSNWYNGETVNDTLKYHSYCLVETKAPEGFQLLAEPVEFDLTVPGMTENLSEAFAKANRDKDPKDNKGGNIQIVNMPDNLGNRLPLTGGMGVAVISVFGILLVGGGVGYYVYSNRRKDA
ncbi:SpaH/EbpB family LPXTG-anchored major pilin [Arcanobacterium canis]